MTDISICVLAILSKHDIIIHGEIEDYLQRAPIALDRCLFVLGSSLVQKALNIRSGDVLDIHISEPLV